MRLGTDLAAKLSLCSMRRVVIAGAVAALLATAATSSAAAEGPNDAVSIYRVQPGDTIDGIAARFGLTRSAVLQFNPLPNPDFILIGQELRLPGSAGASVGSSYQAGYVRAPYRSQLDGSREEESNCGPATLGMFMSSFGEHWSTAGIRRSVNEQMGVWHPDNGSTWESLAYAARVRGFEVHGLYDEEGLYRMWTIDDLLAETAEGRPVMLLVRYWSLPGKDDSSWWGDHYILFLGLNEYGDVVYHDPAYHGDEGAYRTMSRERLLRAWSRTATGIKYSAMALRW